jgi:hypothetical protein
MWPARRASASATDDGWHFPYFMKIELFVPGNAILDMIKFLNFAGECFRELGATPDMLSTEQTDQGIDILINGHRGRLVRDAGARMRGRPLVQWVYGTGLAPRFSQRSRLQCPSTSSRPFWHVTRQPFGACDWETWAA